MIGACNWIGGERAVLAVDYSAKEQFKNAGYEPIMYGENLTVGGNVKQFGNYSFSRVYQAGHEGKKSLLSSWEEYIDCRQCLHIKEKFLTRYSSELHLVRILPQVSLM